jgi:hypothetical protein
MHTFRKLPTSRPRMAKRTIRVISTGVYCGRIIGLKSIVPWYCCQTCFFCHASPDSSGRNNLVVSRVGHFLRLPAQERISHSIDDIPDVGGIGLV